ncbi:hypothetical protein [Bacillus sp. FJAT-47783]|uniref:hypothetical protein n=1 Tax=Bacillus sp. FJAT-47783 TaxID=2922712 RepID=UPI001FAC541E|nr:hypothetical protein [Bacillus sp. FJAT-47783]
MRFFDYWFSRKRMITIEISYYDYLRGKIFIEDLRDSYNDNVPVSFDIAALIYMLYDDFLLQVKRGTNHKDIAKYLLICKGQFKKEEKRVLKQVSSHVFQFEVIEEDEEECYEYESGMQNQTAYLDITVKETELLRAEVLFFDLEQFLNDEVILVEELMKYIYLDFGSKVKESGNSKQIQKFNCQKIIFLN